MDRPSRGSLVPARALSLAVLLVLASAGSAAAQAGPGPGGGACRDDMARLCANVPRGGGGVARCLQEHEADLSPPCRDAMAAHRAHRDAIESSCQAELAGVCKDSGQRPRLRLQCLRTHKDQLSAACQKAIEAAPPPAPAPPPKS
ncbi:MAG TPA: hypothetical protein VMW35_22435 [Myxococcota bacterium]|jgi:hypothetical protein|nr:hypothetical protein [Myxococcota bacterium]